MAGPLRGCFVWLLALLLGFLVVPSQQQVSTLLTEGPKKYEIVEMPTQEGRVERTATFIRNMVLGGVRKAIIITEDERIANSYSTKIKLSTRASVGISFDKDRILNSSARRMDVLVVSPASLVRALRRKVFNITDVSLLVVDDVDALLAHEAWEALSDLLYRDLPLYTVIFMKDARLSNLQAFSELQGMLYSAEQRGGNYVVPHADLLLSQDLVRTLAVGPPQDFARQAFGDYKFKNLGLLTKAFLHTAYKAKQRKGNKESFEPLDYIGNFVLDYMVSKYILQNAPNKTQHFMASKKTAILKQESLAFLAAKQNFHRYVLVDGENERKSLDSYVRSVQSVQTLADLVSLPRKRSFLYKFFKSVAGAVYVDSGYDLHTVETIYMKFLKKDMDALLAAR